MKDGKITISDIANELGVSKTTVSRAISGKGRIGDDTKSRIMQYIEEHNYIPNVAAKSLAQQKTYSIAVVWPGDYNAVDLPFFQKCMFGINEITSDFGYDIIISIINGDNITSLKRIVDNHKVDGVILTRTMVDDIPAKYLKQSGLPFVVIGSTEDDDIVQIDNDHFDACREMTSILIAKGLKRLALLGGQSNHVITRTRYKGFVQGFKDNGLEPYDDLIYMDLDSDLKIETIINDILKKKIDGVICMDDNIAGKVLAICRANNIKIPQEMRVASFYNSSILENATPSVTSLNFNDRNLGAVAARSLLEIIDGRVVANQKLGNYEVILKESTK
ncbi:MAG: LacI family transcriptional regulator [Butyrivibrio sp.]|nr:LacI family transcriptional regulator [Butyrivibrio sp.]